MSQVPSAWFELARPERPHHDERRPRLDPLSPDVVCARIAELHAQTNNRVPASPLPGSELAEDDHALNPYQLSHAVTSAINIAADHLEAFRALLVDAHRTHPWAHHTLLRSAVENASSAIWLVGPDDPVERRYRRLRLAAHDAWESGEAQKIHGLAAPSGRSAATIRQRIREMAPDDRDPLAGYFSYKSVVRDAATYAQQEADVLELLWRAESGLAHGRQWASIVMLTKETSPSSEDGVLQVLMTVSVEKLMPAAATALNLVRTAQALYAKRSETQAARS